MPVEFKLPDLGEGIHEGEIIEVLVKAGDQVEDGQTVAVIETDKATTEVPSPVTGTVLEVKIEPGQTVGVGEVLIVFLKKGESRESAQAEPKDSPSPEALTQKQVKSEQVASEGAKSALTSGAPVAAAPSTRRLARELGIDIAKVTPSGPNARVTPEDVRAFSEKSALPKAQKQPEAAAIEKEPVQIQETAAPQERVLLHSVRKATAQRMALAWAQIPHVNHMDSVDLTALEHFRRRHKEKVEAQGGELSLMVFVMKAAAAALKKFPFFNSSIDMESGEIILKHYRNIGFAIDTERGLLVPVIRDVDRKSIFELALEFKELSERTRQGKASRHDLSGGTFTITNVGPFGGTAISPIINYPEAAIFGMARAKLEPVVVGDEKDYEIVVRSILPVSITFDHRILDGVAAARFVNMIKAMLEDPENLLLMS